MARPREFDADAALDRAMEIFWSNGYEGTSLDDLCEVTELSRSSLYATFGSKRNLLLLSVDRYVELRNPCLVAVLAQPLPIREAFATLARQFIGQIVSGPGRRGCFLGNCAAELPRGDCAALARVRRGLEATQATFADALNRAQIRGQLRLDADVQALARFLMRPVFRACGWSARLIQIGLFSKISQRRCWNVSTAGCPHAIASDGSPVAEA